MLVRTDNVPKQYVVTSKKGNMITAASGDHTVTRNSSRFKGTIVSPDMVEDEQEDIFEIPQQTVNPEPPSPEKLVAMSPKQSQQSMSPATKKRELPSRSRRPPAHLSDYVRK